MQSCSSAEEELQPIIHTLQTDSTETPAASAENQQGTNKGVLIKAGGFILCLERYSFILIN